MGELDDFTEFLFGKESGYVYAPVKRKSDDKWIERFFFWPMERKACLDYIRTEGLVNDCYISPILHKIRSRESPVAKRLKESKVVWVEFDGKLGELDLKGVPEPNYIIQTSTVDNKHLYWKIEKSNNELVEDTNRRLTYFLEADSSGWDISQVLRVPETINHKPGKNLQVQVLSANPETTHPLAVFDKAPRIEKAVLKLEYGQLLDPKEIISKKQFPDSLEKRINREIPVNTDRSSFLMSTGYLLAEFGCNHIEIITLLYEVDHRIKKFVGRADQLTRLSEIAALAILKSGSEKETTTVFSFTDILEHKEVLNWLVTGFLHSRGLLILSGPPGVGKTILANNMLVQMATGGEVLGKPPVGKLRVAYISIEMDVAEMQYFIAMQSKGWTTEEYNDLNKHSFVVFPEEASIKHVEEFIKLVQPQVVIIDSLSELILDGDDKKEQHQLMKTFRRLKREYNCAFILIHHQRKATGTNKKPVSLSDLYGSFHIGKLSETVLCLWKDDNNNHFDLYSLKGRFNDKVPMKLTRDENLNYTVIKEVEIVVNPAIGGGKGNSLLDMH